MLRKVEVAEGKAGGGGPGMVSILGGLGRAVAVLASTARQKSQAVAWVSLLLRPCPFGVFCVSWVAGRRRPLVPSQHTTQPGSHSCWYRV